MMTKDEFIQRSRAQQKHGNGWGILWLVLFFGFLTCGAIFSKHLEAQSKLFQLIFGIATVILIIGQPPLLFWLLRREIKKFGLHCPSCNKPLVGVSAQVAIAAGHCGHCGTKLFSDSPTASTPNDHNA